MTYMAPETVVVIFEPNFGGHRFNYCRAIVQYCADHDFTVVLATSTEGLQSEEFGLYLRPLKDSFDILNLGHLPNILDPGYFVWLTTQLIETRRSFRRARLVVLEGDKLLPRLLTSRLILDRMMTVMVMRMPESLRAASLNGIAGVAKFLVAKILRAARFDLVALLPADEKSESYSRGGIRAAPDPVDIAGDVSNRSEAQGVVGLDASLKWFGVFGHVTERKNLDLVATALLSCNQSAVGLLVAGKISEAELERCRVQLDNLERADIPVVFRSGLLTDVELDTAIRAVDVAVMAHSTDGPSGILGKAAAVGTQVVAAGAPVLRRQLERRPGWGVWVDLEVEALAVAFSESRSAVVSSVMAGSNDFAEALLA